MHTDLQGSHLLGVKTRGLPVAQKALHDLPHPPPLPSLSLSPLTLSASATWASPLFLQHTRHSPAPGPLHRHEHCCLTPIHTHFTEEKTELQRGSLADPSICKQGGDSAPGSSLLLPSPRFEDLPQALSLPSVLVKLTPHSQVSATHSFHVSFCSFSLSLALQEPQPLRKREAKAACGLYPDRKDLELQKGGLWSVGDIPQE